MSRSALAVVCLGWTLNSVAAAQPAAAQPAAAQPAAAQPAPPAAAQPAAAQTVDKELQGQIDQAVERGVDFLKKSGKPGSDVYALGGQALHGWTLLECGVPAKDELVQKLAERVRHIAIEEDSKYGTYSLSLALIFLDKLADPIDEPLIESLTVRLLAGQNQQGGWTYPCPPLTAAEKDRLKGVLKERRDRVAAGEQLNDKKRTREEALRDMRRRLQGLVIENNQAIIQTGGDNSNTQFAMMALWVARRHDLPVEYALAQVGKRFRASQDGAGAWHYHSFRAVAPAFTGGKPIPPIGPMMNIHHQKYPAMTCAGLLGLALEKGVQAKAKDLLKDPMVARGMEVLSKQIESGKPLPLPNLPGRPPEPGAGAPGAPGAPPGAPGAPPGLFPVGGRDRGGNYYYYLFSLERMAVVYNIKTIGKTDWYVWGAEDLVNAQSIDGSWIGGYTDWHADTCFALLFLKRANIAHDLTDLVKGIDRRPVVKTPVKDPLLDLPQILPKEEKKKAAPAKESRRTVPLAPDGQARAPRVLAGLGHFDSHPSRRQPRLV